MIPRTAHMVWIGSELPPHLGALVDTFRRHHPDWGLRWWHEEEIASLPMPTEVRAVYDRAAEIVPGDSVHQMRSDIARYAILRAHGGMYADCDFRWQQAIDPHLAGRDLVCGWELQDTFAATGIIAASAGHPALDEVLDAIPRRAATKHPSWRANRVTGPHAWTPVARRHAHILPQALLHPVPWNRPADADGDHPGAVAVHMWNHQRELRGIWPTPERSKT